MCLLIERCSSPQKALAEIALFRSTIRPLTKRWGRICFFKQIHESAFDCGTKLIALLSE